MNTKRHILTGALVILGALAITACGSSGGASSSPTAAPPSTPGVTPEPGPSTTAGGSQTIVSVYFLRGQFVGAARRAVPATGAPARAALTQLLAGPTNAEQEAGLHTQIPPGTELLGLTISDGVATADLSAGFAAGGDVLGDRGRLAEVVYTLTQFPTVRGVRLKVDGEPVVFRSGEGQPQTRPQTRRSFEDVTPAIFVELPAAGDQGGSPLLIQGTANTFEAQFFARVRDAAGETLTNKSIMATSGSGTRGTFNETLDFSTTSPTVTLEVYESSAADGSEINLVRIPLQLAPGE